MTEIINTTLNLTAIIEENDESTLIVQEQESVTIVEMDPGVPGDPGV
jgi:hypothetical protein